MRLISLVFLASLVLAAPSTLDTRQADEACVPTQYTIRNWKYTESAESSTLSFEFASTYSDPTVNDPTIEGVTCHAEGKTITGQSCSNAVQFDLRAPQDQGFYQLTHTWSCNGKTWMSGTPYRITPQNCNDENGMKVCASVEQSFEPQNVRNICGSPTCQEKREDGGGAADPH